MLSLEEHVGRSMQVPVWPTQQRQDLERVVRLVLDSPLCHESQLVAVLHQDCFDAGDLVHELVSNPAYLRVVDASFQDACLTLAEQLESGEGSWTFVGFLNTCRQQYWLNLVVAVLRYHHCTQAGTVEDPFHPNPVEG